MTIKKNIFNYFTKSQKSELCYYIANFVKKNIELQDNEIIQKFLEEEEYYININFSRHPWLEEHFDNQTFIKEVKMFVKENRQKYEYKSKFKEQYEKQKEYQKKQRKIASQQKMSREAPSKAQLSYYKSLCKKYKINTDIIKLDQASKLDLKNAIEALLQEQELSAKKELLSKLNMLIQEKEN